ncbi:MAG: DM13 domain-containing protein [Rhodospirillales bacterium]|nr:DM13 domain-containing protein [Rhodospirillales bacterium]
MRFGKAIAFVIGGLLGTGAGFALGIFVYPYIFLADIVATETATARDAAPVATGTFVHANPSDPIHWGRGRVSVYRDAVFLHDDFKVGPGPKFHVYLVPDADVTPTTEVEKTMFVDLGRLRAFQGSQNYAIPAGIDPARYGSVVIWCEHFKVLISPAKLAPANR